MSVKVSVIEYQDVQGISLSKGMSEVSQSQYLSKYGNRGFAPPPRSPPGGGGAAPPP
ncbi:hypothetical protein G9A89_002016, partial [Geosiphon pyriformis]